MPDLSDEYIELCRKLALPREWRHGDYFGTVELDRAYGPFLLWWTPPDPLNPERGFSDHAPFWLPREGDLLDLLEAEGGHHIEVIGMDDHSYTCTLFRLDEDGEPIQKWTYEGAPDDRKLALCRLYMAVKGTPL